jgi:nucleotide-binding universal stress UspA family protein
MESAMETLTKLFRKILCPIEFEPNSMAALEFASRIAQESGGRICLLHVVSWSAAAVPVDAAETLFETKQSATAKLHQIATEKLGEIVSHETTITVASDAAAEVVRIASQWKADVVIMATHGRKGLSRMVLGSVAERVVRECPCPVLTVRGQLAPVVPRAIGDMSPSASERGQDAAKGNKHRVSASKRHSGR